ncbi:hypothetical protein [Nitrosopumilus sp. S4]
MKFSKFGKFESWLYVKNPNFLLSMLVYQKKPLQERKIEEISKEEKMLVDLELGIKKEQFKKRIDTRKNLLKEENQIVDLELAIKKEEFKIKSKKRETRVEL